MALENLNKIRKWIQKPILYDLHSHLYGCLEIEDLYWLYHRRFPPQERWEIFNRHFKKDIQAKEVFQSPKKLKQYYYFKDKGNFQKFQHCFDLILALAQSDSKEFEYLTKKVVEREKASYVEYRVLFSSEPSPSKWIKKIKDIGKAFARVQEEFSKKKTIRLAIGLSRENKLVWEQYRELKRAMKLDKDLASFLVALDFCHQEEGFPPSEKQKFFQKVLSDNKKEPQYALAILYHVGESYTDKSVESATRWVLESALYGAHRLGHAIALGIAPSFYLGKILLERPDERLAQIQFELKHTSSLEGYGYAIDQRSLEKESQELKHIDPKSKKNWIAHHYNTRRVQRLELFQNWAMAEIKKTKAIIEVCPTSNLRIANLKDSSIHPLSRFLKNKLKLVLGSDDSGLLQSHLAKEYKLISKWPNISRVSIKELQKNAILARSTLLSGRE